MPQVSVRLNKGEIYSLEQTAVACRDFPTSFLRREVAGREKEKPLSSWIQE